MIKVENTVKIYEMNGEETASEDKNVKISSHWNRNELVNIKITGVAMITVSAKDLESAIRNATNTARF
ncbi:MAG: hypothetical protein GY853_15600 [PVC group bacterium]|nr:hypothetical protein [PVC group bacterium]